MAKNVKELKKGVLKHYQLYFFVLPALVYYAIFHYAPIYGIQIAFKEFYAGLGIMKSPWVGLKYFEYFFNSPYFFVLMRNTIGISLYSLIAGFPLPILLALMLNEVENEFFKKTVQNITYIPHFISTVALVGMIFIFLSPKNGIVNTFIELLGGQAINFMAEDTMFKHIYVWSGIWQSIGWSSIIYLAALTNIDVQLYEAATIDGATKFQKIIHINIPYIMPTMVIMLILNAGKIMDVGFEKIFLMQNPINMETSDVISTYVYRIGLQSANFSFSAAVGLFNSVVNCILLVIVNLFSRRFSETSLW